MSKMEMKAILRRIEILEKRLDSWQFYKNCPDEYGTIRKELDDLYSKLPEGSNS